MGNDHKAFLVTMEDTVVQVREYVVRADSADQARANVQAGQFMFESKPTTVETVESHIQSAEEII